MSNFLNLILQFAEANKDNIGATTKIEDRDISITKQLGIKCITIKNGDENINTNIKSISNALLELNKWIKENKGENETGK